MWLGICLLYTGVQILLGEIRRVCFQHVQQCEISLILQLIDDTFECLSHSTYWDQQDYFKYWYLCRMFQKWYFWYFFKQVEHCIQSQHWIPLLFITNHPRRVILHYIHQLFKSIPVKYLLQQPLTNLLSLQCVYRSHCCCGQSLAMTHFIHHQHFWHIKIPNPSARHWPVCPILVHQ